MKIKSKLIFSLISLILVVGVLGIVSAEDSLENSIKGDKGLSYCSYNGQLQCKIYEGDPVKSIYNGELVEEYFVENITSVGARVSLNDYKKNSSQKLDLVLDEYISYDKTCAYKLKEVNLEQKYVLYQINCGFTGSKISSSYKFGDKSYCNISSNNEFSCVLYKGESIPEESKDENYNDKGLLIKIQELNNGIAKISIKADDKVNLVDIKVNEKYSINYNNLLFELKGISVEDNSITFLLTKSDYNLTSSPVISSDKSELNTNLGSSLCFSGACLSEDGKCIPIGVRSSGKFCSLNGDFQDYKKTDSVCENNFECDSNLCLDSKCISGSFLQKISNWFKKMFGED